MATHFFHSDMVGAPTNTDAAGSTLAIIRAVLSTGFNLLTPQSATVSSGVMTLTYSAPHGYEDKVLLRLDGAPGGSVVRRVTTSAGSSSLTIPAPGFADGAVSGSLSTRVAPAGWEEVFTDTGVGVFRSTVIGPGSTRFYYRVADTVTESGPRLFRGFESMTDASTGVGPFPTVAQESGNGLSIYRASSSTAQKWCVVADGRTCYIFLTSSSGIHVGFCFGDFNPYSTSDLFNALALGTSFNSQSLSSTSINHYSPRIAVGTGAAVQGGKGALFPFSGSLAFPSFIDGGMVFSRPVLSLEGSTPRGEWRGLMCCSANPVPSNLLFSVRSDVSGVAGRVLVAREAYSSTSRCVAFPIDEDWP